MKLQDLLTQLFPVGCKTVTTGWLVSGEAEVAGKTVSVIGTTEHTFIGVREIVALSEKFLDIAERFPGRPIVMLVDNNGQRMALDEELLALPEYVAHLLKAEQVARLAGCKLIAIVYGNTVAGGFIGFGMGADRVVSVPGGNTSVIRVRWRLFCMSSSCEACVRRTPASIARCAANALAEELETYPKPRLVSFIDQGSHPDMGVHCFLASITAIEPYFAEMARAGATGCSLLDLQRIGIAAEESMLDATGGKNTHRGAIYCLGLLAAAAGMQMVDSEFSHLTLGCIVMKSWGEEILLPQALLETSAGLK